MTQLGCQEPLWLGVDPGTSHTDAGGKAVSRAAVMEAVGDVGDSISVWFLTHAKSFDGRSQLHEEGMTKRKRIKKETSLS